MSVYAKLNKARVLLAKSPMKKSGYNTFGKWAYFQLNDFLPRLNEICEEVGICPAIQINDKRAELYIFDTEGEGSVCFECGVPPEFELKGQTPIQLVGSIQTYLTRYLYVTAFGVAENDAIDQIDQNAEEQARIAAQEAYEALCKEGSQHIIAIKEGIKSGDLERANKAWHEFTDDEKMILWKAPTKGGIFTTEERNVMKSTEFRKAGLPAEEKSE